MLYIYIYIYIIIDIELRRRLWITPALSLDHPAAALDHPAPPWITPPPPSDIELRSKENHVLSRDIDIELRRRLWITPAPSLDHPAAALDHPAPPWITPPPPSDIELRDKENRVLRRHVDIELRRRLWITPAPSLDRPAAALDHPAPLGITPPPPSDIELRSKEKHVLRRDFDIELRRRLWITPAPSLDHPAAALDHPAAAF